MLNRVGFFGKHVMGVGILCKVHDNHLIEVLTLGVMSLNLISSLYWLSNFVRMQEIPMKRVEVDDAEKPVPQMPSRLRCETQ